MRTLNISFTLNEREYELLVMAKSDKPDPQRVKKMLLAQAASLVRRMAEDVMQNLHGQVHVNSKAELREINRERRRLDDLAKPATLKATTKYLLASSRRKAHDAAVVAKLTRINKDGTKDPIN